MIERLPGDVRAIAVSQRGHGASEAPPAGYRVEDFAADAIGLLDALELERAVLVGHSGSCLAARRVALDHPTRVAGLVLEASPTTLAGNAQLHHFLRSVVSELADPISPAVARSLIVGTSSATVPAALVDVLADDAAAVPARVWRETFAGLLAYDDLAELPRLRPPALLVWGDADAIVPRAMQDELAARIPAAELRVYAGAGHTPRWEAPGRFAHDVAAVARRAWA